MIWDHVGERKGEKLQYRGIILKGNSYEIGPIVWRKCRMEKVKGQEWWFGYGPAFKDFDLTEEVCAETYFKPLDNLDREQAKKF